LEYKDFLERKRIISESHGMDVKDISSKLFNFQKDIVKWSLKKGRAGLFEDCGLGKTIQQLEWAKQIYEAEKKDLLILAPLAVSRQTAREAEKLNMEINICREQKDVRPGVNITNYEMLNHFNPEKFIGVVLDESSILKSYMGKTKQKIIKAFDKTPYKLSCTATPSPNDHMEILNQAEFCGIMKSHEALAIWFINDTMNSGKYKLKGHAVKHFWEWVSTWAVCISKPSDLGYSDDGFELPPLNEIEEIVNINEFDRTYEDGLLRKIETNATAFHKEKRYTADERAKKSGEIVQSIKEQFIVWCDTNYEADILKKYIPGAVEIRGSDSPEYKEQAALGFIDGSIRVLISKPSIFGFGLNFQNCHNTVFCGLSYSYEDYYQAIRRFWRFGQKNEVNAYLVLGSTEKRILENIRQKEQQHEEMKKAMYGSIKEIQNAAIRGVRYKMDYDRNEAIKLPKWIKGA